MVFRTEVTVKPYPEGIDFRSKIFMLGSCFSENIGNRLQGIKMNALVNPFGILYNPISQINALKMCLNRKEFAEKDFFFHNDQYNSFDLHSSLSDPNLEKALENVNEMCAKASEQLKNADWLVITLGTAWRYFHLKEERTVANCHKVAAKEFSKTLVEIEDVEKRFVSVIRQLRTVNPKVNILFTVSPVRHLKDGVVENQRSKGRLLELVGRLTNALDKTYYFPAYEIMMDDLRDYRFYAEDMVHPNKVAIDYIWNKFLSSITSPTTQKEIGMVEQISRGAGHRPFNPSSPAHQKFVQKQLDAIEVCEKKLGVDFSKEKHAFTHQLIQ